MKARVRKPHLLASAARPPEAVSELRRVVRQVESLTRRDRGTVHEDDLRAEAFAMLMDAMDRVERGLGTRLMHALYPHTCAPQDADWLGAA